MIKETYVMTAPKSVDPARFLREQLETTSPDLLRDLVKTFADALMSAEADAMCGAPYGTRSDERTNSRNGYRAREWDTRAGTMELASPKLRTGTYFPDWLLAHRRRAEQALVSAVATSYLLGVSTRRVEKLVEQLGVASLSKSQVSQMATPRRSYGGMNIGNPRCAALTVTDALRIMARYELTLESGRSISIGTDLLAHRGRVALVTA